MTKMPSIKTTILIAAAVPLRASGGLDDAR